MAQSKPKAKKTIKTKKTAKTAKGGAKKAATKKSTGLMAKLKSLVPGKKATPGRAYKNVLDKKSATKTNKRANPEKVADPAHAPGHRHIDLNLGSKGNKGRGSSKTIPQNETAMNNMAPKNNIARVASANRRIITGAALGKTGRQG